MAMRCIFSELAHGSRSEEFRRKTLTRMVDAARACQAEQGRVIDAVYGVITGRDRSLRDQVLSVVDAMKDLVMENLVHKLNPDAWTQTGKPRCCVNFVSQSLIRFCIVQMTSRKNKFRTLRPPIVWR
jgi:hypothetical protein